MPLLIKSLGTLMHHSCTQNVSVEAHFCVVAVATVIIEREASRV